MLTKSGLPPTGAVPLRSRERKYGAFFKGGNGWHCDLGRPLDGGDGEYLKDTLLLQLHVFFSRIVGRDNELEALAIFHSFYCVFVVLQFPLAGLEHLVSLCWQRLY
jgi:hypothetical protein